MTDLKSIDTSLPTQFSVREPKEASNSLFTPKETRVDSLATKSFDDLNTDYVRKRSNSIEVQDPLANLTDKDVEVTEELVEELKKDYVEKHQGENVEGRFSMTSSLLKNSPFNDDIHLKAIILLSEVLDLFRQRRKADRESKNDEYHAMDKLQDEVHGMYQSQVMWMRVLGILGGTLGILGGVATAASGPIVAAVNGVGTDAMTDGMKNTSESISKILNAGSGFADTGNRISQVLKEGDRYPVTSKVDQKRMRHEDLKYQIEDHKQGMEGIRAFLSQWIQNHQDIGQKLTNR